VLYFYYLVFSPLLCNVTRQCNDKDYCSVKLGSLSLSPTIPQDLYSYWPRNGHTHSFLFAAFLPCFFSYEFNAALRICGYPRESGNAMSPGCRVAPFFSSTCITWRILGSVSSRLYNKLLLLLHMAASSSNSLIVFAWWSRAHQMIKGPSPNPIKAVLSLSSCLFKGLARLTQTTSRLSIAAWTS